MAEAHPIHALKILQLVRLEALLEVLRELLQTTAQKLTAVVPKEDNNTSLAITVEVLSILKRVCANFEVRPFFLENKLYTVIIDLVVVNHPLVLKTWLDFLYAFFEKTDKKEPFVEELGQIFYLSKLLFVCEKYEDSFKVAVINLLTRIMDFKIIQDNFRRLRGVGVLVALLKKSSTGAAAHTLPIQISVLNCMHKLI
jgi:hypothetical protein